MQETKANGQPASEGDLKVWIIPQVPGKAFEVDIASIEEGFFLVNLLGEFQLFLLAERVMSDYSNVAGVVRFEDGEWSDVDEKEYREEHGDDGWPTNLWTVREALEALR